MSPGLDQIKSLTVHHLKSRHVWITTTKLELANLCGHFCEYLRKMLYNAKCHGCGHSKALTVSLEHEQTRIAHVKLYIYFGLKWRETG